jgi:hypothetical protein
VQLLDNPEALLLVRFVPAVHGRSLGIGSLRPIRGEHTTASGRSAVPVREIAYLVGYSTTSTTETLYRTELPTVILRARMSWTTCQGQLNAS